MSAFVTAIISGLSDGCLIAIIALGFTICFRAGHALNFAQGTFMVLAGYVAISTVAAHNAILGLLVACIVCAALSGGGYLVAFRRFRSLNPITITIITMGASFVLGALVDLAWHGTIELYNFPGSETSFHLFGRTRITALEIVILVLTPAVFAAVEGVLRFTRVGIRLRACSDLPSLAARSGIDVNKHYAVGWGVAGLMAGLSGALYAATSSVSASLGDVGLAAFPAAVLGGFGNVPGALLGGLALGVSDQLIAYYVSASTATVIPYLLMLVVLIIRPTGFFGARQLVRS